MNEALLAAAAALLLGLQTSISPCPLTANIAAISFLGREAASRQRTAFAGLAYTLGRAAAYVAIAWLLAASLLGSQSVSRFLQLHMQQLLGPLLLLTGIVLLDLLPFSFGGNAHVSEGFGRRLRGLGLLGAFVLGVLFALAFCPVSAVLFFGQLLPLVLERESPLLLPLLYGVGTAIPVLVFVFVIAFGTEMLGKRFQQTQQFARWTKLVLGTVLLLIGLYMTFAYTLLAP